MGRRRGVAPDPIGGIIPPNPRTERPFGMAAKGLLHFLGQTMALSRARADREGSGGGDTVSYF